MILSHIFMLEEGILIGYETVSMKKHAERGNDERSIRTNQ